MRRPTNIIYLINEYIIFGIVRDRIFYEIKENVKIMKYLHI